jgi:hypothetical protein
MRLETDQGTERRRSTIFTILKSFRTLVYQHLHVTCTPCSFLIPLKPSTSTRTRSRYLPLDQCVLLTIVGLVALRRAIRSNLHGSARHSEDCLVELLMLLQKMDGATWSAHLNFRTHTRARPCTCGSFMHNHPCVRQPRTW